MELLTCPGLVLRDAVIRVPEVVGAHLLLLRPEGPQLERTQEPPDTAAAHEATDAATKRSVPPQGRHAQRSPPSSLRLLAPSSRHEAAPPLGQAPMRARARPARDKKQLATKCRRHFRFKLKGSTQVIESYGILWPLENQRVYCNFKLPWITVRFIHTICIIQSKGL